MQDAIDQGPAPENRVAVYDSWETRKITQIILFKKKYENATFFICIKKSFYIQVYILR